MDDLKLHLRPRRQEPSDFDLGALVVATDGWSGAEIEQAVVAGLYRMLAEGAERLTTARLLEEVRRTAPLSRTHRERLAALRAHARGRFVFAN
jgi:hypothetical protein